MALADIANLYFSYEGKLPGTATMKIRIPKYAENNVFIYYYNPEKNILEKIESNVPVDSNGWLSLNISHCSDYIVSKLKIQDAVIQAESEISTQSSNSSELNLPSVQATIRFHRYQPAL